MSIRQKYQELGVYRYYKEFGIEYRNPHEDIIKPLIQRVILEERDKSNPDPILDLACGSGEVTVALQELGIDNIEAIDPYTYDNYLQRTGKEALKLSFNDVADGALHNKKYSLVICSYALHLCELSILPNCCWQLSLVCPKLIIFTPHKKPNIKSAYGFNLIREVYKDRVKGRIYER